MSNIQISNISTFFGHTQILNDISFDISAGEFIGIIGCNGCGKTTLLRSICNLLPHLGTVHAYGQPLEELSTREISKLCSYVPAQSDIDIDISVLDVVLMGYNPHLKLLASPSQAMRDKACDILSSLGLGNEINTNYLHLSEGQQHLCIIARTLITDNPIIILDEPENALDFSVRYRIMDLLKKYATNNNRCVLASIHDISLALNYCDRILLVSNGKLENIMAPAKSSLDSMSAMLSRIYGDVRVCRCDNDQLVMIRSIH